MKIKDVVCAAGSTGFYFDDQRAIKRGAGHDGMFYIGQPVTEGFSAVRMKGEAVSVMIILEDGQIAFGDCAAVQYSGAGGRDPLFLAKDFIPIIEQYVRPMLLGREADDFRGFRFDSPAGVPRIDLDLVKPEVNDMEIFPRRIETCEMRMRFFLAFYGASPMMPNDFP